MESFEILLARWLLLTLFALPLLEVNAWTLPNINNNKWETRTTPTTTPRTALYATHRKKKRGKQQERSYPKPSRDVALAIVPPDQAWDTLQRARHVAQDKTYQKWPPCLRLFHPFAKSVSDQDDLALSVASVIDKYQIEPFEIRLTGWSVIPHAEAMEADWKAMKEDLKGQSTGDDQSPEWTEEELEFQNLIAEEERKGKEKLEERIRRNHRISAEAVTQPTPDENSPRALWEKQRQMYEEFNGPCVVCLEPDEESRHRIMELRELLLEEEPLAPFASFAPTLTLSDTFPFSTHTHSLDYRPMIPIASFPTVTSAVEMARKLRSLWDPLTIPVTDLQVISTGDDQEPTLRKQEKSSAPSPYTSWLSHSGTVEEEEQMGCDALIMLAGEEVEMDDELNEEMANLIAKEGLAGGFDKSRNNNNHVATTTTCASSDHNDTIGLNRNDGDTETIFQFLDDEEDDDGTVVVIGRTHFFTGEMRLYVGMPATSVTDSKDRTAGVLGVSGAARRRGVVHRSGFEDGEWGRRSKDYSPWGKHNDFRKRGK